jgi:TolB-like protein
MGDMSLIRKPKVLLIFIIMLSLLFAEENRIAVLGFKSENVPTPELKVITDRMRTSMVEYDFLQVMERSKIKDLLKEQSYQHQDYFSNEEAVAAGRMVGANYILAGSIQELESGYYVSARLIEIETTATIAQQDLIVEDKNFQSILLKIPGLADKIVSQFAEKKGIALEKSQKSQEEEGDRGIDKIPDEREEVQSSISSEEEWQTRQGGFGPCVASCLIGPRVGLEMNEGKDIHTSEWISLAGNLSGGSIPFFPGANSAIPFLARTYMAYEMGYKANGMNGRLASFFLGPRIGNELDYREIREKEWMMLIPCVNLYPLISIPLEAYRGETMKEIEKREGLRKK